MAKNDECIEFKNFERKIKSSFMIYGDFEIVLVHGDNGKENPNNSYTKILTNIKNMLLVVIAIN